MAAASKSEIERLVAKYKAMLGVVNEPGPEIKIVSNLGAGWWGMAHAAVNAHTGAVRTTLHLQKAILEDPTTLERIIAHEVIHYWEYVNITDREKILLKHGVKPVAHGASFKEGMDKINAVMGKDYVTVNSDRAFKIAENKREFYVLVRPISTPTKLGWQWAARLSPQAISYIHRVRDREPHARLLRTVDVRFASGAEPKIRSGAPMNVPGDDKARILRDLYESSENLIHTI